MIKYLVPVVVVIWWPIVVMFVSEWRHQRVMRQKPRRWRNWHHV